MCCCNVSKCCCGCTSMSQGVMIWAIIDAVVNFLSGVVTIVVLSGMSPGWYLAGITLWDILLALGAHFRIYSLLVVWQIFMMVYIVMLFSSWIIFPVLIAIMIPLTQQIGHDPQLSAIVAFSSSGMVFSIILPPMYVYFWIVVNSLRKNFARPEAPIYPMMSHSPMPPSSPMHF